MKVVRQEAAVAVDKEDGTHVRYYAFPEYEIHYNEVLPQTTQQWHHHELIEEVIYVVLGSISVYWEDQGETQYAELKEGDLVRVERTPHTFTNFSRRTARFMVFRMVPDGSDKHEIIKADKVEDIPPANWRKKANRIHEL